MRKNSGSTEGRVLYHRWKLRGFEYRSDLIAKEYMRRWLIRTPWFMLRLHHILRSDDRAHFHDHPMDFTSLILAGGYVEHRPGVPPRQFKPGDVVRHRAEDLHSLELTSGSAWTVLVTGSFRRNWGFATEDGWIVAGKYDAWKKAKRERWSVSSAAFGGVLVPPCDRCSETAVALDWEKGSPTPRCGAHRT